MGTTHCTVTQDMLVRLWGASVTMEVRCWHHQILELERGLSLVRGMGTEAVPWLEGKGASLGQRP